MDCVVAVEDRLFRRPPADERRMPADVLGASVHGQHVQSGL